MGKMKIKDNVFVQNNKNILDSILQDNQVMEENISKNELDIDKNELDISKNELDIEKNKLDIDKNELDIDKNELDIDKNAKLISNNFNNISGNSVNISGNSKNISENSKNIYENKNNISGNSNNISENLQNNTKRHDGNERRMLNHFHNLIVGVEKNTLNHLKKLSNKIDEEFDTVSETDEFVSVLQQQVVRLHKKSLNDTVVYTLIENDMMS
jgi:hypothetical protein